jgi:glycosyltransferase involved in cell wall biosynthesis
MAPLQVLFVSSPFLGFAGSGQRYRRYFARMPARGVRPEVLTQLPHEHKRLAETPAPPEHGLSWTIDVAGVPVHVLRLPRPLKKWRRHLLYWGTLWRVLTGRAPRIIHILLQVRSISLLYALAMRLSRRARVLSITKEFDVGQGWFKHWILRVQFESYHAIFCQSEDQLGALKRLGVRKPRLIQVPNGVDTEEFHPASADERLNLRRGLSLEESDAPLWAFVGSVQPRKGTHLLLEAWSQLARHGNPARLLVIGPRFDLETDKWPWFTERLAELSRDPGLADRLTFTGPVANVREYLMAADAFILPSKREGVPNAVLEAMACGLPCVLTPFFEDSTQLGEAGEHFRLCDHEAESIAEAVAVVGADLELARSSMGARARALMVDTMSVDRAVDAHCELYRELQAGVSQSVSASSPPSA